MDFDFVSLCLGWLIQKFFKSKNSNFGLIGVQNSQNTKKAPILPILEAKPKLDFDLNAIICSV